MTHLRDLGRRKVRTTLTILGITIGIWALVVFGSMANKINALVAGGSTYYADKVEVSDGSAGNGGGFSLAPMSIALADKVRAVDGVAAVAPAVVVMLDGTSGVSMGIPPMLNGEIPGSDQGHESFQLHAAQGRLLTAADEGSHVVVLGADLARQHASHIGDTFMVRDVPFTVVGILEPTLTAPDSTARVPLAAAQEIFLSSLPPLVRTGLVPSELATTLTVYPKPGVDTSVLADRIRAQVPNVGTMTGRDFDAQVGSATGIFNAILIGIALISLVVGGLSVVNTMAMSITERTREIGIKRAIGGSQWRIVREFVAEAGLMGAIGGGLGLGLGAIVVVFANDAGRASGNVLFDLTTGTALTALLFATVLGAFAGFVPALRAARLDPVSALRYE